MVSKDPRESLPPKDSWKYMENLVMDTLNRLEKHDQEIFKRLNRIDIKLAKLSVKSGIWGLIGACIPVALGLLIAFLKL
jgi:hypothetical protein